jgi:hypothetical protein
MAELRTAHTVSLCTGSSCHPTGLLQGFEYASRLKASCGKKCMNLANHRWDLRFSHEWKLGLWSFRLWHCAVSQVISYFSDESAASTFSVEVSQTGCDYVTYKEEPTGTGRTWDPNKGTFKEGYEKMGPKRKTSNLQPKFIQLLPWICW